MKSISKSDEMLPEYDFSKGVRGKHAERYHRETNVVVLDPDVAERFPNSEAVNQPLRSLARILDRKRIMPGVGRRACSTVRH
jgi:hypothetical protein